MVQTEDGTWYGCALGVRPQGANFTYRQLGRESYLFPITWEDGWPIFNGGKPLTQHLEGVLEDRLPVTDYYNDFSGIDTLDLSFYSTRTPYKPFHTLTARPGYLRIKGNGYAPGDRDSIAMLMRKQTSYNQSFETLLEFSPTSNLTEAGISIFTSDQMHNEIAVVGSVDGSKRSIITRKLVPAEQVGPWALTLTNNSVTTVEYHELNTPDQPIRLTIIGNSTQYTFGYAEGDSDFVFPLTFDSLPLSAGPVGLVSTNMTWKSCLHFSAHLFTRELPSQFITREMGCPHCPPLISSIGSRHRSRSAETVGHRRRIKCCRYVLYIL